MLAILCQKSAIPLLPQWLVLALAQMHALYLWLVMRRLHEPWLQLVMAHIAVVVLPTMLLKHGQLAKHTAKSGSRAGVERPAQLAEIVDADTSIRQGTETSNAGCFHEQTQHTDTNPHA